MQLIISNIKYIHMKERNDFHISYLSLLLPPPLYNFNRISLLFNRPCGLRDIILKTDWCNPFFSFFYVMDKHVFVLLLLNFIFPKHVTKDSLFALRYTMHREGVGRAGKERKNDISSYRLFGENKMRQKNAFKKKKKKKLQLYSYSIQIACCPRFVKDFL